MTKDVTAKLHEIARKELKEIASGTSQSLGEWLQETENAHNYNRTGRPDAIVLVLRRNGKGYQGAVYTDKGSPNP